MDLKKGYRKEEKTVQKRTVMCWDSNQLTAYFMSKCLFDYKLQTIPI